MLWGPPSEACRRAASAAAGLLYCVVPAASAGRGYGPPGRPPPTDSGNRPGVLVGDVEADDASWELFDRHRTPSGGIGSCASMLLTWLA